MKKFLKIMVVMLLVMTITACNTKEEEKRVEESVKENETIENKNRENEESRDNKSIVIYFSATGTTKEVATKIAESTNSKLEEIVPKVKYTSADLSYNNDDCRANIEQKDNSARPEIANELDVSDYNVIFLGYPIWWGTTPKIILTLLDTYNFEGKIVVPFCTSGSSSISNSVKDLKAYNNNINFLEGRRFTSSVSSDEIDSWVKTLNIS